MAEVDSIGNNFYFAGVQNTTSNSINKNQKKQEIDKTKKSKFASLLSKQEEVEPSFSVAGLPPEIAAMSLEDAAVYLKDAVDLAGNDLSSEVSQENIKKFQDLLLLTTTMIMNIFWGQNKLLDKMMMFCL